MSNAYRLLAIYFSINVAITFSYYASNVVLSPKIDSRQNIVVEKSFETVPSSTFLHLNQSIKRIAAIDRIFLINLPDRVDRRTTAIALFQKLHLDLHIFPAFHSHSPEVLSRRHHLSRHLTQLELACWASHVQLWTHIALTATNTHSWTLIFEDDVDIEMSIVDILESFPSIMWTQAEMIYLGYCGNPRGELLYTGRHPYQLHRARNPSCTHAYAIRSDSASKLIRLVPFPDEAIDNQIVRLNDEEKVIIYSIHPPVAIQDSRSKSSINLHEHRFYEGVRVKLNRLIEWWKNAEAADQLNNSTLLYLNMAQAKESIVEKRMKRLENQ